MQVQQVADVLVNNVIEFRIKTVYGRDVMYIASDHATAIERLTGKKTIDFEDKKNLESLGFIFTQVF